MQSASFRNACIIVLIATLLRLILAAGMGLGIDESYMVAAAHSFHLSYFDHPLMSWWMELSIQRITGLHAPVIVRLPFILAFAITSALTYGLTNRLYGPRAAFWAVVGLTVSPVFSVAFGTWVLPDGPLDLFLVAAAWALARALGVAPPDWHAEPEPGFWPLAGLLAGLAIDSKYNAALTLLGALIFIALDPRGRRALATARPWIAGLIALIVIAPILIWNAQHGWASLGYQSARATGFGIHPLRPFIVWAGEALFVGPWIFIPMIALLIGAFRRNADRRARFLALLAIVPIMLFSVVAFWSSRKILYHWAAPGYLMLFPLLGDWAARLADRARARIAAGAIAAGGLLAVAALFIVIQLNAAPFRLNHLFRPGHSPVLQAIDWTSFRTALAQRGDLGRPHVAVAALRWYDAGKIAYALGAGTRVTVFEGNPHEFGITTPPQSLIGDDILIAAMPGDQAAIMRHYAPIFRAMTVAKPIDITHHGRILLQIPILIGHDLKSWPVTRMNSGKKAAAF